MAKKDLSPLRSLAKLFQKLTDMKHVVSYILVLLCLIELIWGYGQLFGIDSSIRTPIRVSGSFDLPPVFGGLLAILFPLILSQQIKVRKDFYPIFWGVIFMLICLMLITKSRAAWLACFVSITYYFVTTFQDRIVLTIRNNIRYSVLLSFIFILVIICLSYIVYYMKKDSADGRLLIWKIGIRAVAEEPVWGHGWNYVLGAYGQAQERYFSLGLGNEHEQWIADSPKFLYNEYLHIAMAWGIPVFLLLIVGIVVIVYWGHRIKEFGVVGSMLAFLVFAFFSFPLQYALMHVVLYLLIVYLLLSLPNFIVKFSVTICFTLLLIADLLCQYRCNQFVDDWKNNRCYMEEYCNQLYWNEEFLFNYGLLLNRQKEYKKSQAILNQGLKVSSDVMFLNIQGKNAWAMGCYEEAETWFIRSTHRVPNRVYPYYLLAKLYNDTAYKHPDKVQKMAKIVMTKKPKVLSSAIKTMRSEMNQLLNDAQ